MSEYWVSKDRYWCKYCKVYIADDKPVSSPFLLPSIGCILTPLSFPQSRLHHETGLRHKGNYERFIRDIYKRGEKDKKDKAEEATEMARMEAVSSAHYGEELVTRMLIFCLPFHRQHMQLWQLKI